MSSAVEEENFKQNASANINFPNEKNSLTFKDWKYLKDDQLNHHEKSEKNGKCFKPRIHKKELFISIQDNGNNFSNNGSKYPFVSGHRKNFHCNSGLTGFPPHSNSNGINGFNNFNLSGSSFDPVNIWNNNNGLNNNLNRTSNISGHNFRDNLRNFQGSVDLSFNNLLNNSFGREYNRYTCAGRNRNDIDQSKNFFTSDNVYPQRDMMQKPLLNPFRCEAKANRLLQDFDMARFTKDEKKKQTNTGNSFQTNKPNSVNYAHPGDIRKPLKEPEVYVPNPKGKQGGKPYIQKPKFPEQNSELNNEEIKQQWKEYRQATKPFKNRDFYNAKRVVQRLGKKDPSELDEKQLIRLKNAEECMAIHKARLSAKYPNYVKTQASDCNLGEVYVLKTVPVNQANFVSTSINNRLQNCSNFGESQPNNTLSGC